MLDEECQEAHGGAAERVKVERVEARLAVGARSDGGVVRREAPCKGDHAPDLHGAAAAVAARAGAAGHCK